MNSFSLALAIVCSTASAFAPQCTAPRSISSMKAMPDRMWDKMVDPTQRSASLPWLPRAINLDGSMPGDVGFDPFYLSSIPKDWAGFIQPPSWEERSSIDNLYWMQEAEIKHGRVAMLAWFGWIATDGGFGIPLRFPGEIYKTIPNAYEAHNILVGQGSMTFLLIAIAFIEFCCGAVLVQVAKGENERLAGDYSLDPLSFLKDKSEEEVKRMKTREIANGRLAMLAFGGIATQSALSDATHNFPYF